MEMLLLSGGLLIALIVAIFFISKLYGSFEGSVGNRQYMDLEAKLADGAKEFIQTYDIEVNGEYKISYESLKSGNFVGDLKDIDGNSCNGYVKVTNIDNVNHYKGYILCNNYQTLNY